jgi:hypothetical protein
MGWEGGRGFGEACERRLDAATFDVSNSIHSIVRDMARVQVHAMNVLRSLFRERTLYERIFPYRIYNFLVFEIRVNDK